MNRTEKIILGCTLALLIAIAIDTALTVMGFRAVLQEFAALHVRLG